MPAGVFFQRGEKLRLAEIRPKGGRDNQFRVGNFFVGVVRYADDAVRNLKLIDWGFEPIGSEFQQGLATGGRSLARQGTPLEVAVDGVDADPWYTLRQWQGADGAVSDWELDFADPDPALTRFPLKAPEAVAPGQPMTVTFTAPVPNSGCARSSVIMGISRFISGNKTFLPCRCV